MNLNIELTEKERKFLAEFAEKQHEGAKDNIGTCTPIHLVERIMKDFVDDGSGEVWVDADNDYATYDSFDELCAAHRNLGKDLPDYEDVEYEDINDVLIDSEAAYCKAFNIHAYSGRYVQHTQPVAFFFIHDEAVRYKDGYQKHNCGDCRIYTYGLGYSNNGDMPVFRELLMKMGTAILQEVHHV